MKEQKTLTVAIIGEPNAGKSTLVNQLVGMEISIVTHKVQTTRESIKGILTEGDTQIVFLDTPGIFEPDRTLEKAIVSNALSSLKGADIICLMIDLKSMQAKSYLALIEKVQPLHKPIYAIINKIDLVAKENILPLIEELSAKNVFIEIFPISALKNKGVEHFKKFLMAQAKPGAWLFPEDEATDRNVRTIAEDITRKHAYLHLHKELPYSLKVETEKWEEGEKSVKIYQCIYLLKQSQKAIALGTNGAKLKDIGMRSRHEIAKLLGKKVHLFLYVKVRENWIEREFASNK